MDRRDALKMLAAVPVALATKPVLGQTEHAVMLDDANFLSRNLIAHELFFREHATYEQALFDGGPEYPGAVYTAFHEAWRTVDGKRVERLSQVPSSQYRILSPGSTESHTFSFYDHEGKGRPTVRLHEIQSLSIWHSETEFVIAETPEHAVELYTKFLGYAPGDKLPSIEDDPNLDPKEWSKWSDDKLFPLSEEGGESIETDDEDGVVRVRDIPEKDAPIFRLWTKKGVDPAERDRERACKAPVSYIVNENDEVWYRVVRKLPQEWVKELGCGWFSSTES
jgi:hypothetical protein